MTQRELPIRIAYVVPLQGSAGIFGPSCEACGDLAVAELCGAGGLLGREVELVVVDGGRRPDAVAREVVALWRAGAIDAVVGWHISAVRKEILRCVGGELPYVYAALHEGEFRTPGLFMTGESPGAQVLPALNWLRRHVDAHSWCVVGNDYVWPRQIAARAESHLTGAGMSHLGSTFTPLGTSDFSETLDWLEVHAPDAALVLLIGDDAVRFGRAFARRGLDEIMLRFSPILEENQVLAMGATATANMYSAAGYFDSLATAASLDFAARYHRFHGVEAPTLNSIGQSCYEAINVLGDLATRAGSLTVPALEAAAVGVTIDGSRGALRLGAGQADQDVYVAAARHLDLDVLERIHVA
ncbi:substrate-binding domain-containing protein [Gordonia aichiensis]|uniref:Aliphatic amidase regulator n=1 Tax=Gordonia aichiensis NBRC 108223 TaxID=1220583 RepID=L7KQR4_9ACTN|nr:substrate-binding domain-containing protein [Gordonia aichiensis]GAC51200.1 aliphatic amidase regulator [Gordonia aichiensis NBRC 108223]